MSKNSAALLSPSDIEAAVDATDSDENSDILALAGRLARKNTFDIAESYAAGAWDAAALDDVLCAIFQRNQAPLSIAHYARILRHFLKELLVNPQTGRGAFSIGKRHYDLGNDLFTAMLDSTMSYTCGYWPDPQTRTLEQAQIAKLDLTCRKLKLAPGMTVLDIGCGWGNFAKFAAENYGVAVVGVTVSQEQAVLARERCRGLPVEILVTDYRNISSTFDRVVSIEMIEAVGRRNLSAYFNAVDRCLKADGLFVLEVISAETVSPYSSRCLDQYFTWIERFIFPNGYLPRLDQLAEPARRQFTMEDLHHFGPDYDRTLLAWEKNFERAWPALSSRYTETFRRRWRFYLLSCAALFRIKMVHLYQVVYSKRKSTARYNPER